MKSIIKVKIEKVATDHDRNLVYPLCAKAKILASLYGRFIQSENPDLGYLTGEQKDKVRDGESPISKIRKLGFEVEIVKN